MVKPFSTAAALVLAVLLLQCCQDEKGGNAGRLTTFEPCVTTGNGLAAKPGVSGADTPDSPTGQPYLHGTRASGSRGETLCVRVKSGDALVLETEGMRLTATGDAVKRRGDYSVTSLTPHELPPMPQGMVNMTAQAGGYRLLPSGDHFDPPAELRIAYDPALLPPGYTADDIYTSYYDNATAAWVRLERAGVDTVSHEIVSLTTHFTDFVNELLKSPEMPETQAFVPTAMTDLEAVNPLEGLPIMQPPAATPDGGASLSYPIEVPSGRGGMQPSLTLAYSSSGGNGWLGVGWDISVPSITLDTRWGVPRYSTAKETELYLLNGEQLVTRDGQGIQRPMPHRTNRQTDRLPDPARFYARTGDAHDSIVRHGTSTHDYWWEVTDRTGVTHYYGHYPVAGMDAANPSTLADDRGNIARWMLCESRDPHGNWVRYFYDTVTTGGRNPGRQIYPDSISYTGHGKEMGQYSVVFVFKDRSASDRPTSCNLGFKEETDKVLCHIRTRLADTIVTAYHFETECRYESNFKTRLKAVSRIDGMSEYKEYGFPKDICRNGLGCVEGRYTSTEFTYHDAPSVPAMFDDTLISHLRSDDIKGFMLTSAFYADSVNRATALGLSHSKSWNAGGTLGVGLGPVVCLTSTSIGGNYHRSKSASETQMTLVDLDGDGLSDKVYVKGGGMYWCRQTQTSAGRIEFGQPLPVAGPGRFLVEGGASNTLGVQASVLGIANGSGSWTWDASTVSTYLADVDGDGLVDIVDNGDVWFNHPENGRPTFTLYRSQPPASGSQEPADPPVGTTSSCGGIIFDGGVNDSIACETVWDTARIIDDIDHNEEYLDNLGQIMADSGYVLLDVDMDYAPGAFCATYLRSSLDCRHARNLSNWGIPQTEPVRVWVAPDSGTAMLQSTVRLIEDQGERRWMSRHADGVTYTIQHSRGVTEQAGRLHSAKDTILMSRHICAECYDDNSPSGMQSFDSTYIFRVEEGDILFFRLQSNDDRQFDNVLDYARITLNGETYDSHDNFILSDDYCFQAPYDGDYTIEGSYMDGSGDVQLQIKHYGSEPSTYPNDNNSLYLTGSIDKDSVIRFDMVATGSYPNWGWTGLRVKVTFSCSEIPEPISIWTSGRMHVAHPTGSIWGSHRYRRLFGLLPGGWGQFAYHPLGAGTHDVIRPASLVPPRQRYSESESDTSGLRDDINDTIRDSEFDSPTIDDFVSEHGSRYSLISDSSCWVPMTADAEHGRWVAFGAQNSIGRDTMSGSLQDCWYSSELAVMDTASITLPPDADYDDPVPVQTDEHTPVKAIRKASESFNHSYTVGVAGFSDSYSNGHNDLKYDYLDLNGDRYPDIVGPRKVQYRSQWGGMGDLADLNCGQEANHTSVTNSIGSGFGASPVSHKRVISGTPSRAKYTLESDGSVSGSFSVGENHTPGMCTDMNGDGLPDYVTQDSLVRLNTGYGFLGSENWHVDGIQSGQSVSASVSVGVSSSLQKFNVQQGSIQAGAGLGRSANCTGRALVDINGDGLPDQVWRSPVDVNCPSWNGLFYPVEKVHVRLNLGGGRWSGTYNLDLKNFNWSETYNESLDAGLTLGLTFFAAFKATAGASGAPYGGTVSRDRMQLADVDGDGLPDLVTSGSEGELTVRRNLGGRTNLLRKVTNFTGSKIYLDYTLSAPSCEQPSRSWLLTQVATKDPLNPVGGDTSVTRFAYHNPHYDRLERAFFGYGTVATMHIDPSDNSVYRTVQREQHNGNLLFKGKPKRELTCDGDGNIYVEKLYDYTYNARIGETVDTCSTDAWERLRRDITRHYEGTGQIKFTTAEAYEYDRRHNVVAYHDDGDTAYSDDGLRVEIGYLGGRRNNLIGLRNEYRVYSSGGGGSDWIRRSTSQYDTNGKEVIRRYHTAGQESVYDFVYDSYGCLSRATLPPNDSLRRMEYRYTYDSRLHTYPVKIRNSFGDTMVSRYDLFSGKPLSVSDPSGSTMRYSYDASGRLLSVTSPLNNSGSPSLRNEYYISGYTVDGIHSEYAYSVHPFAVTKHFGDDGTLVTASIVITDGFGRVIQTKKGLTAAGQEQWQVSGKAVTDAFGRTVGQHDPFTENLSSHPGDYNAYCNTVSMTATQYDILDRTVLVVQPLNLTTHTAYGVGNDLQGRRRFRTSVTDPMNHTTVQYSDHDGRQVQVTDAEGGMTVMEYDALGQLLSSTDPEGFSTSYEYDRLGRMTKRIHPDAGTTQYGYDLAGNMVHEHNPLGDIFFDYTYDRLVKKRYSDMTGNDVTYFYDTNGTGRGRPVMILDGTGKRELAYDALGNVVSESRTIALPGTRDCHTITSQFVYDSWGRMLSMAYPDGEVVTYGYVWGGDLVDMVGDKGSEHHVYVSRITYNAFGQRSRIDYGNGTYAACHYDVLHRLDSLSSVSASGAMQRIKYNFDGVGNITRVRNSAPSIGTMGGEYTNLHSYDALNRLVSSGTNPMAHNTAGTYSLEMAYSPSGRPVSRDLGAAAAFSANTGSVYGYCDEIRPHAPLRIFEMNDHTLADLVWDGAGNLGQVNTSMDNVYGGSRFLFWTEDSRLHTVADDKYYSYYVYDHAGERTIKLTGSNNVLDVNASQMTTAAVLSDITLYPSPYIVFTDKGYTKHYYAGADRLCTRLGGGGLEPMSHNTALSDTAAALFGESARAVSGRQLDGNDNECIKSMVGDYYEIMQATIYDIPQRLEAVAEIDVSEFLQNYDYYATHNDREVEAYFYHGDHLGSASWITDANGIPVQHLQYLPFGEPFVNQHTSGYKERFTFTGKERDEETGYGYFGARYYDSDLSGLFLSVDPMADKYPSISPYAYCAWNPLKLVDPDGRDWDLIVNCKDKTVTIRAQYAVQDGDEDAKKSAEEAIKIWNDLSGKYSLKTGGEKYNIMFDLSVINMSEYDEENTCHNTYSLVPFFNDANQTGGTNQRKIQINYSEKDNFITTSHEIGHTLGLLHNVGSKGLMEDDGGRLSGNNKITKFNILDIIKFSFHPELRDNKYDTGKGTLRKPDSFHSDLSNYKITKLLTNKK